MDGFTEILLAYCPVLIIFCLLFAYFVIDGINENKRMELGVEKMEKEFLEQEEKMKKFMEILEQKNDLEKENEFLKELLQQKEQLRQKERALK